MPPQIPHVELTDTLGEELALFAFGLLEATGQCTWLGIWKPAARSPTSSSTRSGVGRGSDRGMDEENPTEHGWNGISYLRL